jgi:hypothetical protein
MMININIKISSCCCLEIQNQNTAPILWSQQLIVYPLRLALIGHATDIITLETDIIVRSGSKFILRSSGISKSEANLVA